VTSTLSLLDDDDRKKVFVKHAQELVRKNYDIQIVARTMLELYEDIAFSEGLHDL